MPLLKFLSQRIFVPLGMQNVVNIDQSHLEETDPTGYIRYALGPPRPAPREGKGWLFAAGELAMPARDLAKWDIGLLNHSLLKPASYKEMEADTRLKDGLGTRYGLGIEVRTESGRRALEHGGEVSGFTSRNIVFPDDHAAIIVLTNQDSTDASARIARRIAPLLLAGDNAGDQMQRVRGIFEDLQHGKINRSLFTGNGNSYFTRQAIEDFQSSLQPLGAVQEITQAEWELRGGMIFRRYTVKLSEKTVELWIFEMPDGKIEEFQIMPGGD